MQRLIAVNGTNKKAALTLQRRLTDISSALGLTCRRTPAQQFVFNQSDRLVENAGENGQKQNSGEHRINVEHTFRLQDEIANAACRAQIFTDDAANECEAHGV